MTFTYVDNLQIGDPILVSEHGSFLRFGWFAGYGRNTIQYFTTGSVVWAKKAEDEGRKFKPSKAFVQITHKYRIAKIQEPVFNDQEDKDYYEEAKQILIEKGLIKQ